jgi:hypothetical protein
MPSLGCDCGDGTRPRSSRTLETVRSMRLCGLPSCAGIVDISASLTLQDPLRLTRALEGFAAPPDLKSLDATLHAHRPIVTDYLHSYTPISARVLVQNDPVSLARIDRTRCAILNTCWHHDARP